MSYLLQRKKIRSWIPNTSELIPIDKQNVTKLKKKGLVSRLMETNLGKSLGAHSLLSMHLRNLQEKADPSQLSIDIDYITTSMTHKYNERERVMNYYRHCVKEVLLMSQH